MQLKQQQQQPVERQARLATKTYRLKLKEVDKKYASEIVGDGTNGVIGPFERSLDRIATKNVVLLVIG